MLSVSLPKSPKFEKIDEKSGRFIIEGCYPGYGTTLGNAIRRVLLSSLPGAAVTAVKITGVTHEFTTIKGALEDVVQVILNLKQVRFKLHGVDSATVFLKVKGEKAVTAGDIKSTSEVEVVTKDQHIATLTSSTSELEMELKIERGLGYVPVEQQEREEKEIGTIAIDAIYSPIKRVNFLVENMRVGKRTDYDKITLEVVTDGTIDPKEAYEQALAIILDQFQVISKVSTEEEVIEETELEAVSVTDAEVAEEAVEKGDVNETALASLELSTRTLNVLNENNIKTVGEVANYSEEELKNLEGMGDKGIKEIKKAIGKFGITLKA